MMSKKDELQTRQFELVFNHVKALARNVVGIQIEISLWARFHMYVGSFVEDFLADRIISFLEDSLKDD